MKVVMKVVLQTDSQMRKYKQTNKKVKKRKMAFKNANATERRHLGKLNNSLLQLLCHQMTLFLLLLLCCHKRR